MDTLRKQRGETERHYKARRILLRYLKIIQKEVKNSRIDFEFPHYGGRARADLALVTSKPPIVDVEIWVEVQDTKLSNESWKKKLKKIVEKFHPKILYVAITENLSSDLLTVFDLVSKSLTNYRFSQVDTKKNLIYDFVKKNGIEIYRIKVERDKLTKKKMEISLDQFIR